MSVQPPTPQPQPRRSLVFDTVTGRTGELMARSLSGRLVHLRPVDGGTEWTTEADAIRAADADEDHGLTVEPVERWQLRAEYAADVIRSGGSHGIPMDGCP